MKKIERQKRGVYILEKGARKDKSQTLAAEKSPTVKHICLDTRKNQKKKTCPDAVKAGPKERNSRGSSLRSWCLIPLIRPNTYTCKYNYVQLHIYRNTSLLSGQILTHTTTSTCK